MATAVLRSHDVLNNRMHLDAFTSSPTKPRRRRSPKPAGASSPPPKAVASPAPPKSPAGAPKAAAVLKAAAVASPPAKGRRSPPPKSAARKQPSPTKEKQPVMGEIRILKRGEELPASAPAAPAPVGAPPVTEAAPLNKRVIRSTSRIGPKEPTVVPKRVVSAPDVAVYAGPAFASAPEPSSLPFPAFCLRRAETEATRGLRCLLGIGQVA
ncbi:hypothetical protein PR202_ga03065 [Eleusine coracana subsp. coracana]|uniref:Uncharacterized protein n=1 Tax=Eleusine coracana subsp. coracana TaxID=191504 RepID=A0AAV5BN73_ELECO|nr:hypothetical protein QOZ80_2AG0149110 [Eleusine coracana subsp. coracana]GJM87140.1 hypothetical protein PR202_ga03065 [Eleusine coracana subsp. coracana]